jgi:hypothetical protein
VGRHALNRRTLVRLFFVGVDGGAAGDDVEGKDGAHGGVGVGAGGAGSCDGVVPPNPPNLILYHKELRKVK